MKFFTFFFLILFAGLSTLQSQTKTKNVILITIDGLRWREVFAGADSMLAFNKTFTKNPEELAKKFWNTNALKRRELLMPFVWSTVAKEGQIYGNRNSGSLVNVANPHWFSYPGYSEILCGFADERVNSNNIGPNPNITVLEFINKQKGFEGKVAVFSSWETFNDILNEPRSHVYVNAAYEPLSGKEFGPKVELLNEIQSQLPDVFFGVRLDAATFHMGFEYLKAKKPRILYIALDETDDFAHHGSYDYYMNSIRYTDDFIKEIWTWVQNDPQYKNQTTLMITVDHGRGSDPEGWKSHGAKTPNSSETWFAVIGPDTPAKGEISGGQYFSKQYATTIAKLLNLNYTNVQTPGEAILPVLGK
jgi:hypothetical protein